MKIIRNIIIDNLKNIKIKNEYYTKILCLRFPIDLSNNKITVFKTTIICCFEYRYFILKKSTLKLGQKNNAFKIMSL